MRVSAANNDALDFSQFQFENEQDWSEFIFGIPGQHLVFSQPVRLEQATDLASGSIVSVQVQHEGESEPGVVGLTLEGSAQCDTA